MAGINPDIKVEPAGEDDLVEIKNILNDEALPYNDLTKDHLKSFLIIRDKNKIIATVGAEIFVSSALLRSLVVLKKFRKKYIAQHLLIQIESWLQTRNIFTLYLLTTTAEDFFAKHKYLITKRSEVPAEISKTAEFTTLCPDSAVCMVKKLKGK